MKCEHLLCKNYSCAGFTYRLKRQQRFLLACQHFPLLFVSVRTMHDKVGSAFTDNRGIKAGGQPLNIVLLTVNICAYTNESDLTKSNQLDLSLKCTLVLMLRPMQLSHVRKELGHKTTSLRIFNHKLSFGKTNT